MTSASGAQGFGKDRMLKNDKAARKLQEKLEKSAHILNPWNSANARVRLG